jgi:hypothetical protein
VKSLAAYKAKQTLQSYTKLHYLDPTSWQNVSDMESSEAAGVLHQPEENKPEAKESVSLCSL